MKRHDSSPESSGRGAKGKSRSGFSTDLEGRTVSFLDNTKPNRQLAADLVNC
jgi:hypothetical protein